MKVELFGLVAVQVLDWFFIYSVFLRLLELLQSWQRLLRGRRGRKGEVDARLGLGVEVFEASGPREAAHRDGVNPVLRLFVV